MTDISQMSLWFLDKMLLPKGGFTEDERKAALNEIKRRCGWGEGAVKMPPKPEPMPELRWTGAGWMLEPAAGIEEEK